MFAINVAKPHIISVSVIIGAANIICRRQTSLKKALLMQCFFLAMGYKKDISGGFAYEFEHLQYNEILADARMKSANADEILGFASDEIKSTHRRSDFTRTK